MKVVFKSDEFAELNRERHYLEGFAVEEKNGLRELWTELNFKGIHSKVHRIYCPGIICSFMDESFENELVQILESDFPYIQMHFELSSTACMYYPAEQFSPITDIPKGTHSLLFYPALNGKLHYKKKPLSFSVQIELSLDFLRKIFNNDLEILNDFGKNIEKNLPAILGHRSFPITTEMKDVIFELRTCAYHGSLKKLFTEAKVIELLTLQIDQINQHKAHKILKKDDIDKLNAVREIVLNNISNPYSIEDLSKIAGINRTKLQDGFKQLFGSTVFDYLTTTRLEMARQLILEGDYGTIAEVSNKIGYRNHQHFTAAFKRKYGYLPKELKG
jgi:AraC-like DNA-binding protein